MPLDLKTVNRGASANLQQAVTRQDATYNGSLAVTAYGCGARDDNAYSAFILPSVRKRALLGCIYKLLNKVRLFID